MCSGAIVLYKIPRVVVGENRSFVGAEDYMRSNGIQVDVVQDDKCIELMAAFIKARPELWNEDIGVCARLLPVSLRSVPTGPSGRVVREVL
jgi:cytosine/creatinine deaminase